MQTLLNRKGHLRALVFAALLVTLLATLSAYGASPSDQDLTPTQQEIKNERERLSSPEVEIRRDAVMHLGAMHLAAASRACLDALTDVAPMVRAVAAQAVVSLGADESVPALLPLLNDKDEFVRREVVYALGLTHSQAATVQLIQRLVADKEDGVRSAAAVALGQIGDEAAVVPLSAVLSAQSFGMMEGKKKSKIEKNPFVLRAAAVSLGQIKSRAGTPALITALSNENLPDDVRREAARSLGLISDPSALPALRTATNAADPYLSQAAYDAMRKISP